MGNGLIVCGTDWLEDWYRKEMMNLNVGMRGFGDNLEAKTLIAESEVLRFPTLLYEGFLMTIFEAYLVGTSVIVLILEMLHLSNRKVW